MATVLDAWKVYRELVLDTRSTRERKSTEGRWAQHLGPAFASITLGKVNTLRVLRFRRGLEEKALSPQTVQHCLALLRRILRKALRLGLYAGRLPYFDMPRFDNRRQRFLSPDEARHLLGFLRNASPLWHEISLFALQTGLRAGEIFQLTREQVSFHSQHITVFDSKNNMSRHVPLNATAQAILLRRLPEDPAGLFFTSNGRPIREAGTVFRRIVGRSGINRGVNDRRVKVVFHTFRHTFASWLVQAGTPLAVVSTLLGHKTVIMTQRYAHLAPDQARQAVRSLPILHAEGVGEGKRDKNNSSKYWRN